MGTLLKKAFSVAVTVEKMIFQHLLSGKVENPNLGLKKDSVCFII